MQKLFGIIIIGMLLQGCATAPSSTVQNQLIKTNKINLGMNYEDLKNILGGMTSTWPYRQSENYLYMYGAPNNSETNFYAFEAIDAKKAKDGFNFWTGSFDAKNYKLTKIYKDKVKLLDFYISKTNNSEELKLLSVWKDWAINEKKYKAKNDINTSIDTVTNTDINFTIDDKKEQCTAIGFEPATEKFADCVLRLVELDVKSQQATQIALAQSQGNQQVANQLKKQSNDQSSQYFLDLGQKLLNPQSTVSAPSTSTCRVTGGIYKTVSCW
jgi:hypothetical protein